MSVFEKKVNFLIDFDEPIFKKHKKNSLVRYSTKILKNSIMMFNGKVKDKKTLNVVFLSFIIDEFDKEKFKDMTISDIKNIIYNNTPELEI